MLIMALMKKVIHRMKNVKLPDGPSAHCSQLCFVPPPPFSPPWCARTSFSQATSVIWCHVFALATLISSGFWCYNITLFTLMIKEACFATEEAVWRITKSQKKLKCRLHVYDMEEIEPLSSCVRSGW